MCACRSLVACCVCVQTTTFSSTQMATRRGHRKGGFADDSKFFGAISRQMSKFQGMGRKAAKNAMNGVIGLVKDRTSSDTSVTFIIDVHDLSGATVAGIGGSRVSDGKFLLNVFAPDGAVQPQEGEGSATATTSADANNDQAAAGDAAATEAAAAVVQGGRTLLGKFTIEVDKEIRVGVYVKDNASLKKTLENISKGTEVCVNGLTAKPNKKDLSSWFLNATEIKSTGRFSSMDTFHLMNSRRSRGFYHLLRTPRPSLEECYKLSGIQAGDPWPQELLSKFKKKDEKRSIEERIVMYYWRESLTEGEKETMNTKVKLHGIYDDEYEALNPEDESRGYIQSRPDVKKDASFSMLDQNKQLKVFYHCWITAMQWDKSKTVIRDGKEVPMTKENAEKFVIGVKIRQDMALKLLGTRNMKDYVEIAPYVFSENKELEFPIIVDGFLAVDDTLDGLANSALSEFGVEQVLEYVATSVYNSPAKYTIEYGLPVTYDFMIKWIQEEYSEEYGELNFTGVNQDTLNLEYADPAVQLMVEENTLAKETKADFVNMKEYKGEIKPELASAYRFFCIPNFPMTLETVDAVKECAATHDERAEIVSRCLRDEDNEMIKKLKLDMPRRISDLRLLIFGVKIGREEALLTPPPALVKIFEKKAAEEKLEAAAAAAAATPANGDAMQVEEDEEKKAVNEQDGSADNDGDDDEKTKTPQEGGAAANIVSDSEEEQEEENRMESSEAAPSAVPQGLLSPGAQSGESASETEGAGSHAEETREERRRRKEASRKRRREKGHSSHGSKRRRTHEEENE